ncbi:hypothetical protein [Cerasicoccus fimbriatus]|uniref:hypothetical protein n=1 Tax=Cerasicoccus fimbriatus TaxID=3014554 RepID=UPI0022B4DEB0|nr:hypothetical protein [Cerasicoccus sp. TK19100]
MKIFQPSLIAFLLLLIGGQCMGADDYLTLKNTDGKEVVCQITGFNDGLVAMKFADGRTFRYEYSMLDEPSQQLVREELAKLSPPRLRVRSVNNSSRTSSGMSMDGATYESTYKKRVWEVKVTSFCPFEVEAKAWVFTCRSGHFSRSRKKGTVSFDKTWEFEVEGETTASTAVYDGGDSSSSLARLDLVIYVFDQSGKVTDSYATSRKAQEDIEKKYPELKE